MYGTDAEVTASDIDNYDVHSLADTIPNGGRTYQRKGPLPENERRGPSNVKRDPNYSVKGLKILCNFAKTTRKDIDSV